MEREDGLTVVTPGGRGSDDRQAQKAGAPCKAAGLFRAAALGFGQTQTLVLAWPTSDGGVQALLPLHGKTWRHREGREGP